jgi:hypothetical protein
VKKVLLLAILALELAPAQVRPVGVLTKVDVESRKLTMKADTGEELTIVIDESTTAVRVKPGERDLTGATPVKVNELAAGDRVLVRGTAGEGPSFNARQIIVMSQSDLAARQAADRADWDRRGVLGVVKSVDAASNTVVIEARAGMPPVPKPITIQLSSQTTLRRYSPDSVKFADAVAGTIDQIQVGDQLRARGEKSADGAAVSATEVVSGTFRNIAAQVVTVDAATSQMTVTDLDTKKKLTVKISPDSSIRKMPEMMAQMMAMRLNATPGATPGGMPAGAPAGGGAMRQGGFPGAGGFGPGGPGGGGPPSSGQMIERMPAVALADIKPGEALIIASTAGKTGDAVTAITVVSGVEPILTAPSKNRQQMLGSWNVDMGGGLGAMQ